MIRWKLNFCTLIFQQDELFIYIFLPYLLFSFISEYLKMYLTVNNCIKSNTFVPSKRCWVNWSPCSQQRLHYLLLPSSSSFSSLFTSASDISKMQIVMMRRGEGKNAKRSVRMSNICLRFKATVMEGRIITQC